MDCRTMLGWEVGNMREGLKGRYGEEKGDGIVGSEAAPMLV